MEESYLISLSRQDIKRLWKKIKKNKDLEAVNVKITIPDKKIALDNLKPE